VLALSLLVIGIMLSDLRDKGCFLWHRNSTGKLFEKAIASLCWALAF